MSLAALKIVIGAAGSGKSTIARKLARDHGAAYLDKDTMGGRFVEAALLAAGHDPSDRESNAYYREQLVPLEYDSLFAVAADNLRLDRPVVIDAPFSPYLDQPDFIEAASARFAWPAVKIEVIRVVVSPATLQRRLLERGLGRDRVKLAHWDTYWAQHGERRCLWRGVTMMTIDNNVESDRARPPRDCESPSFRAAGGDEEA
jgi:predicted kinase